MSVGVHLLVPLAVHGPWGQDVVLAGHPGRDSVLGSVWPALHFVTVVHIAEVVLLEIGGLLLALRRQAGVGRLRVALDRTEVLILVLILLDVELLVWPHSIQRVTDVLALLRVLL